MGLKITSLNKEICRRKENFSVAVQHKMGSLYIKIRFSKTKSFVKEIFILKICITLPLLSISKENKKNNHKTSMLFNLKSFLSLSLNHLNILNEVFDLQNDRVK